MNPKLREIAVLHADSCANLAEKVLNMGRYWINRNGFYTLGAATYQDDPLAYPAVANMSNPILFEAFSRLYREVLGYLSDALDTQVQLPTGGAGIALPGFHIFDHQTADMVGHPHIDEPYTRVDLSAYDWDKPFSFTLPICLPACGGGLDVWWNFTGEDIDNFIGHSLLPKPEYEEYKLGHLYLHDGLTPHRIANPAPIQEGEFRITLQGHGVHTPDGAMIYF